MWSGVCWGDVWGCVGVMCGGVWRDVRGCCMVVCV